MITGHNTDVKHNGTVFHVQTEDKGVSNPYIETLVYVGGQVLGAKRISYANLLSMGKGEKEITALIDHQHRLTIAAIRGNKFEDKVAELTQGNRASTPSGTVVSQAGPSEVKPPPEEELTFDSSRTLDQVILDYLTSEADQEQLLLMVDGDADLNIGRAAGLAVRTSSSKSGRAVGGAAVSVKMISTNNEPQTLATGETDGEGALLLSFEIPPLEEGAAALIIIADSSIGSAEIKHLL